MTLVASRLSDSQRTAILEEAHRVITDPKFSSSKRCVLLLQYLIEHTLQNEIEGIKERSLGIEVFGREADYDTNADPVVRVTASEIRKRLARYYDESDSQRALRIRLDTGSYLPSFEFDHPSPASGDEHANTGHTVALSTPARQEQSPPAIPSREKNWQYRWIYAAATCLLVLVCVSLLINLQRFYSTEYLLWKPIIAAQRDLVVCVPVSEQLWKTEANEDVQEPGGAPPTPEGPAVVFQEKQPALRMQEARSAYKLSARLSLLHLTSRLRSANEINMGDFHSNPVVLIGGFDNPWTARLLSKLRYTIQYDRSTGDRWIQDAQAPSARNWMIGSAQTQPRVDYAILTRYQDAETGGWLMAMSGLGVSGTEAAVDLISAPMLRKSLPDVLRTARNFQIVLVTSVVNGVMGTPRILTIHTW